MSCLLTRAARFAAAAALLALGACDNPFDDGERPLDPTVLVDRMVVADSAHSAFPHALRLDDGDILVSWRAGAGHMYPPARLMMARYRYVDGQVRHVETGELFDTPGENEREASLAQLRDGTVLASLFTGYYVDRGTYPLDEFWYLVVLRSKDGARTWSDTSLVRAADIRTATGRGFMWLALRAPVVELEGGELLLPIYGMLQGDRRHSNHVLRSSDGGLTWRYGAQIARDGKQGTDYNETSLLDTGGGGVLAMFRSEDGYLRQSQSGDGGRTWSALRKTRVWGIPPHLLTLSDGRVLLSRGYRRDRRGVRYSLSYDGGRTWDPGIEGVLEGGADNVDCGYPSTVELDDGSLWTVYYTSDRPGGGELVATVRAVHYRIPPRVQPGS